jgi:hypothetical protein
MLNNKYNEKDICVTFAETFIVGNKKKRGTDQQQRRA